MKRTCRFSGIILTTATLFLPAVSTCQAISKISCLSPCEVTFPVSDETDTRDLIINYSGHDNHTFWYKLRFDESGKLSYRIKTAGGNGNFDVYFYQYDGQNFCRSFIQNSIELISFEKNLEYRASKSSVLYLGIYPLTPGGCGHRIDFTFNSKTFSVTAANTAEHCRTSGAEEEVVESNAPGGALVSGQVADAASGKRISARITFTNPFSSKQFIVQSNEEGFSQELEKDGDYTALVQAFGYDDAQTAISAYDGGKHYFTLKSSMKTNFILQNVYFYPNTYALKDESLLELESIFSYIVNHPGIGVEIIGHTNGDKDVKSSRIVKNSGEEWNFNGSAKELSLRRAMRIRDYLTAKGADVVRIKVTGKGGSEMIVQDPSDMKEAMQNIRVEIKLTTNN